MSKIYYLLIGALVIVLFLIVACGVANAGAVGGPKGTNETVLANGTDFYDIRFTANEPAVVVARGDGDIDLYVYDENGNEIVVNTKVDHTPMVRWVPTWTGFFRIKVRNCEAYDVHYAIATN